MLASGFYACHPDEIEEVTKGPDTIQTEYGQIIVSEDYVPIDWAKGKNEVLRIEVPSPDRATITMKLEDKKKAAQIQQGSILTVDVDTAMYLRKVVSATIDGTTVTAVTEQGTLEDVFSGSEFEICLGEEPDVELYEFPDNDEDLVFPDSLYDEEEEEEEFYPWNEDVDDASYAPWLRGRLNDRTASGATPRANGTPVEKSTRRLPQFRPTELRYYDENGQWVHESYEAYCARQRYTRGDDEPSSIHFDLGGPDCIDLHSPDDGTGFSIGVKGGATFSCDLGFKMTTNYGDGEFISTYKKGNVEITPVFFFEPSLTVNAQVYIKGEKKLDKETTSKIGRKRLAHIPGPKAVFTIGPVPMWVTAEGEFFIEPEFTFTAEADFTLGGTAYTDGPYELGMKYKQKEKKFSRVANKPTWTWDNQKPTFGLSGSVEAKLYVYPRWSVELYDIIGPYIALKPYLSTTVSAGVNTSTGPSWQWTAALGCEFSTGIKADAVGYELMNKELASKKLGKELQLWSAPNALSSAPSPGIKAGTLNDISVTVQNKILAWKHTNTWVPVVVRFETDGDARELYEYGSTSGGDALSVRNVTTDDGVARVTWYPQSGNSALSASIYAPNGLLINSIAFHPDNTPEGAEGIDMGTGILWANMNCGATDPEESGISVGWGDVTGKHKEQSFDASYGAYVEDEAACLKYYGGASPHRNISGTKYDIATRSWGGNWRMPTQKEWIKLIKACKVTYDVSRDAYIFTNNGKELIFPAAGCWIGTDYWSLNQFDSGEYWTSTLKTKEPSNAYYVGMTGTGSKAKATYGSVPRYYQQSVRPVKDK